MRLLLTHSGQAVRYSIFSNKQPIRLFKGFVRIFLIQIYDGFCLWPEPDNTFTIHTLVCICRLGTGGDRQAFQLLVPGEGGGHRRDIQVLKSFIPYIFGSLLRESRLSD